MSVGGIDEPVFLDTSIHIARVAHAPALADQINERLRNCKETVSGLVVRQEFKRRVLKEAFYLLKQLNERGSVHAVERHLVDHLGHPGQQRKRTIGLQLLLSVDPSDTPQDILDRSKLMLRDLLRNGIATMEAQVSRVNEKSQCSCAQQPVLEKRKFTSYYFGTDHCSDAKGKCGIKAFLGEHRAELKMLHDELKLLDAISKTAELRNAETFLNAFLSGEDVEAMNPCLTVGDLLIAMESVGCKTMYTMNLKESRYLAKFLDQSLLYRPPNDANPEVHCPREDPGWNELLSSK